MGRKRGSLTANGLAMQLLDHLSQNPGYWTINQLAGDLNAKPNSVRKSLLRLHGYGMVVRRPAEYDQADPVESRWAWREVSGG